MTWLKRILLVVALLAGYSVPGAAQGWVEPPLLGSGFAVDKVKSEVLVRIEGRVAIVEVSEWFVNEGTRVAEGHYLYPLPGEAVFQSFSLYQGDAELRGEIMDADQARQIYQDIVRRRADPALIELAGHGLLRARIFPIEPGEERKVTLRYTQVLERAGNALQFVYAGAVRGADRRTPHDGPEGRPLPEPVQMSFEIELVDGDAFLEPFSPTHDVEVHRDGERAWVTIDEEVVGRLSLFLPLAGDAVSLSVAAHRPVGEDGYFMLTLSPDRVAEAAEPRDVTVVLDVSGSMSGDKIVQAQQALRQLLSTLSSDDRFRMIAFSNAVRMQSEDWNRATGSRLTAARKWVDGLVADGGTNIGAALDEAFRLESPSDRLPVVIFLTDGLPSVGEQSPERLADRAEKRAGRARVFAFGVGYDVNTYLLDRLGEAGRGATDYVEPGENVERVISLLATKIRHPVLTDLELTGGPVELAEVYPVRIPDLFVGEELVLFGRYHGEGQGRMTLTGRRRGAELDFSTDLVFAEATEANAYIPRLWAARKLGHLERQIWTEGETESLVDEIRTLALRYGLPSRYTSYLVQEPDIVAAGMGRPLSLDQLVVTGTPAAAPATQRQASGLEAVRMAAAARRRRETRSTGQLREAEQALVDLVAARGDAETTRAVAGRLFRLRDGVWTDVAHSEEHREITVRLFSPAYFDVLGALPELQAVFKELSSVVVAGEEMSVRVGDEGLEKLSSRELLELVERFRGAGDGR